MTKKHTLALIAVAALAPVPPAPAQAGNGGVPSQRPHSSFTAEFKTTRVQSLANGTTITTETKEVMARDDQFRHMSAITEPAVAGRPAITSVRVNDPTTGVEITWTSAVKVAHEVRRPIGTDRHGCWATPDGRYRANYGPGTVRPIRPPSPPSGATAPAASPTPQSSAALPFPKVVTGPEGQDIVMVGVKHAPGEPAPADPVKRDLVRQDLGADTIMGIDVRGTRTTVTTPAGAVGNDQPLVRTDEIWVAPGLGLILRSLSDDPRMGKTDREVVSLDLNAADPSLFQPPADYKVETEVMQPVACAQ